jgi:hypothetical protein
MPLDRRLRYGRLGRFERQAVPAYLHLCTFVDGQNRRKDFAQPVGELVGSLDIGAELPLKLGPADMGRMFEAWQSVGQGRVKVEREAIAG